MNLKVLSIFGTRPEAIKMAPVVLGLANAEGIDSKICVTAQHRKMLDQVLELFGIKPDFDLDLMEAGQDLFGITAKSLLGLKNIMGVVQPDIVLVHGDTTTCMSAALAAFYENIPVGHVEAGLRTGNMRAPFPEEANRAMVGRLATYHFAPTERARQNLLAENTADANIWVTGNTVIDALLMVREKVSTYSDETWAREIGEDLYNGVTEDYKKIILITGHRRENFGQGFIDLCDAIKLLAISHPEWMFVYPVHLNPNVKKPVYDTLKTAENIFLIEPLDYAAFVWIMDKSDLILTDSGGIQEEGAALGKPVLVMRDVTERPEAVDAGTVILTGTNREKIVSSVEMLLKNKTLYEKMARAHNPYGDGKAAERIINAISDKLLSKH